MPQRATNGAAVWVVRCKVRDVERVEWLLGQTQADLLGLVSSRLGERRVALALDELEGLTLERIGRRAVADQPELGGAGRADIGPLAEAVGASVTAAECREPSAGRVQLGRAVVVVVVDHLGVDNGGVVGVAGRPTPGRARTRPGPARTGQPGRCVKLAKKAPAPG